MNENRLSQLSALIDGELPSHEILQNIKKVSESSELTSAWDRYHVIGEILRGERISPDAKEISARVRTSLKDEPTVLVPSAQLAPKRSWVMPLTGSAIAASVAMVVVLTVPQLITPTPESSTQVAASKQPPVRLYAQPAGTRWNLGKPEVESKLNGYLVNHQEYAPSSGMKGMLPYATFVGYDGAR